MQPPTPPQQPVPGQPYAPQPQPGVPMENPGQTLGIVGLVCNFLGVNIAGIILGVMSRNKSKQYNMSTTLGTISMVWGIVGTVFGFLAILFWLVIFVFAAASSTTDSSSSSSTYDYSTERTLPDQP
jgi:hypothetical protein